MFNQTILFTVIGKPETKGGSSRAYFAKGHYIVPQHVQDYEKKVHNIAKEIMNGQTPFENYVKMECSFFFPDKRKRDIQNYFKSVCDALEGAVYHNDSQIVEIIGYKRYDKDNPRIIVFVKELDEVILCKK